jgi:hypothetical protein
VPKAGLLRAADMFTGVQAKVDYVVGLWIGRTSRLVDPKAHMTLAADINGQRIYFMLIKKM